MRSANPSSAKWICAFVWLLLMAQTPARAGEVTPFPTLEEVMASRSDLWGQLALENTNGLTYEFFASLLPPPRYVNADFREYPMALSAPRAPVKARLISNGSGINTRAGGRSWTDPGTALIFRVGPDELRFGEFGDRVSEPKYLRGHLPVVRLRYQLGDVVYEQESFAAVDPRLAAAGLVFVRFSAAAGATGNVAAQLDAGSEVKPVRGSLVDDNGQTVVWYDNNWRLSRQRLVANLSSNVPAVLALATKPLERRAAPLTLAEYDEQRRACISAWETILQNGTTAEVSEPVITNAWRTALISSLCLVSSNRMNYSAGNQYEKMLENEGADAVEALLLWGQTALARELIPPLLGLARKGLEFDYAGRKLQLLARYFQLTRDTDLLKAQAPQWSKELQLLLTSRTNSGLFPREHYSAELAAPVVSLHANAQAWRALRDFAPVLAALGQTDSSRLCLQSAASFRQSIMDAVEKVERKEDDSTFVPIALSGEDEPYETITGSRMGTYWNLMMHGVLGTGIFAAERETGILNYLERHGALCMGMPRIRSSGTFWNSSEAIAPFAAARRLSLLLQRDEPDKALAGFYAILAQGFTRDSFVGSETVSLVPLDSRGRQLFCPPNSAANASILRLLRELLVQEVDTDDDGEPETLRLLFGTPRAWLDDQKEIRLARAPTAFGPVSLSIKSNLEQGELHASIELPPRLPQRTLLRLRLPAGWRALIGRSGERTFRVDYSGAIELVGMLGKVDIVFTVQRR